MDDNRRKSALFDIQCQNDSDKDDILTNTPTIHTILDQSLFGVVLVSKNKRIVWANIAACELMGFENSAQVSGRSCTDCFCTAEQYACPILDLHQTIDNSERMLKQIDGNLIPIIKSVKNINLGGEDLLLEFFTDISKQKSNELSLQKSLKQTQGILDNLLDAYFQADLGGKFTIVSSCAAKMYGYENEQQMIGLPAESLYENHAEREALIKRLRSEGRITDYVCQGKRKDNTAFWVSMNIQLVRDDAGQVIGTESMVRDISERINASIENQRLQQQTLLEMERFNKLALRREERIRELKQQLNNLAIESGKPPIFLSCETSETGDEENRTPFEPVRADVEEVHLEELLDVVRLKTLIDNYCNSMGIAAAVIDLKGQVLVASHWQRACTEFHRNNTDSLSRCIESDTELALNLNQGKDFSIYKCKNGLVDAASPIYVFDKHVANLFIGQFLTQPPDMDFFDRQAEKYGFDKTEYRKSIKEVPVVDEQNLNSIMGFLTGLAKTVASISFERNRALQAEASIALKMVEIQKQHDAAMSLAEDEIQARKEIETLKEQLESLVSQRTAELHSSEERCHLLLQSASEGFFGVDTNGRMTFINQAALKMLRYEEKELIGAPVHGKIHHSYSDNTPYPIESCVMCDSYAKGVKLTLQKDIFWNKTGSNFPVEYSSDPLFRNNRLIGAVVAFKDITERQKVENKLTEKMQELERFNRLTVEREKKMIELKNEINTLLTNSGLDPKYKIVV
ncbi:PocR ligand-binding domain-containing protein [Dehalogenimonas sp. THU2]|uniref:PocR ligand-binding domain-containing protein n=1 Tax=Dehalogenimonas sp. THU2 TaxID=3151121 RepID=UPI00321898E7